MAVVHILFVAALLPFLAILHFIYRNHENKRKRLYARRALDIEHGTFTSLIFSSTGGMGQECLQYHSRLAQVISIKKEKIIQNNFLDKSKDIFLFIKIRTNLP